MGYLESLEWRWPAWRSGVTGRWLGWSTAFGSGGGDPRDQELETVKAKLGEALMENEPLRVKAGRTGPFGIKRPCDSSSKTTLHGLSRNASLVAKTFFWKLSLLDTDLRTRTNGRFAKGKKSRFSKSRGIYLPLLAETRTWSFDLPWYYDSNSPRRCGTRHDFLKKLRKNILGGLGEVCPLDLLFHSRGSAYRPHALRPTLLRGAILGGLAPRCWHQ
jgi:hypothetical protein